MDNNDQNNNNGFTPQQPESTPQFGDNGTTQQTVTQNPYQQPQQFQQQPQPQPQQFQQQPYQNPTPIQNQPQKSSNKILLIAIAVIAVVIICGLAVGITLFVSSSTANSANTKTSNDTTAALPSTKITVGKVTYSVPNSLEYQTQDGNLIVSDSNDDWIGAININENITYSALNESKLKTALNKKFTTLSVVKETFKGREFYVAKVSSDDVTAVLGFTKADSSNTFLVELHSETEDYPDAKLLEKITPILDGAVISVDANNLTKKETFISGQIDLR